MDKTYKQANKEFLEQFSTKELYQAFRDYFDFNSSSYWFTDLCQYLYQHKTIVLREYLIDTLSDDRMFMLSELEEMFTK